MAVGFGAGGIQCGPCSGKLCLPGGQLLRQPLCLCGCTQLPLHRVQLGFGGVQGGAGFLQRRRLPCGQGVQQGKRRFRHGLGAQGAQRLGVWVLRAELQPAQQAVQFSVLGSALLVQRGGFCLQTLLQLGIALGAEQLAEDAAALLRRSVEQLCELPLRNEHDLGKLVVVQPDDLLHGGGHVLRLGHRRAVVRVGQGGIRLFGGHALAPGFGTLVLRVAAHHVAHAVHLKFQLHKGGGFVVCVLAAQHGALPDAAAGMIVQRIGDGVKNSSLARAGVAGNKV